MKINSTLKLTILLLLLMSGAGTASAFLGYQAGTQALKGVSQPENNPTKKLTEGEKKSTEPTEFKPIDEKTILIKVYNHTHQKNKAAASGKEQKEENSKTEEKTSQSTEETPNDIEPSPAVANLPLQVTDQGVKLEVNEATNEGTTLSLKVNLQNEGATPVKFLYSFLEVKDNQGRSLSAITEGLPEELPANSESFMGKVKIPSALVDDSQSLSLNLTDYPDQKLKLNIAQIPVTR
ncbi:hypothetical protein [Crocosphaera chwakensis]|uniref:DUF4352 domain-containing protein n=1 Tax=Crocosphaera chwakensis CCY0110 TaxID=391612 RepID=A3ISF1_9CHRO|nr:hypothetical protein [Crocosphaera chwakensis]EAZ90667.1 hypothetical protein CY0110_08331 [Crocosphaera chwakensis CCY0110]